MSHEWSVLELAQNVQGTLKVDKDFPIIVDGQTGAGKSTLGIKLCKKICPWFDMDKHIIYSRDELSEAIMTAQRGTALLIDEAINVLFRRDFASKKQKFLLRLLDMCRDRNLCLVLCVPNFWSMDKHILEGRVKMRIYVARTGLAFMWKPSQNPFTPDKWYRKYNEKVCWNWDTYPAAKRTKGFIGFLKFGDIGHLERERYQAIKTRKKQEVKNSEEKEERESDIAKRRSVELGKTIMLTFFNTNKLLKPGALLTLAEVEGVTLSAITNRIRKFKEKHGDVLNLIHQQTQYKNKGDKQQFDDKEGWITT